MSRTVFKGANGVSIVGDVAGPNDGPVVFLMHGGGQTRHSWDGTWRYLADSGWRAVSYDLRGHGESGWSPDGNYHIDLFIADLIAVRSEFDSPPVLIGASLGGITSLMAVAESPSQHQMAAGLVLVDIANRMEQQGTARIGEFMSANADGFETLEQASDAIAAYNPHRPRPKSLDGLKKNLRQREDGRWIWHWDPEFIAGKFDPNSTMVDGADAQFKANRLDEAADNIAVPTLLVRGRQSDLLSVEGSEDFLSRAPHAEFADVAGAGHMVAGDRNEIFNSAILGFLNRLRDGGPDAPPSRQVD